MVLSDVKRRGVYHVKQFRTDDNNLMRHLENLGFIPGEEINVVSRTASGLIVNAKGSRIALSFELAQNIVV